MSDNEKDPAEEIPSTAATSRPTLGREDISKIAAEVVAMLQAAAKKNPATTTPSAKEDGSSKGKEPADGELQVLSRNVNTRTPTRTCNSTGGRLVSSPEARYKM